MMTLGFGLSKMKKSYLLSVFFSIISFVGISQITVTDADLIGVGDVIYLADDNNTIVIRDYSEQVVDDEQSIEEYLKSHFYNYEDFENSNSFEVNIKVRIDTITDVTANKTPLYDQVKIKTRA